MDLEIDIKSLILNCFDDYYFIKVSTRKPLIYSNKLCYYEDEAEENRIYISGGLIIIFETKIHVHRRIYQSHSKSHSKFKLIAILDLHNPKHNLYSLIKIAILLNKIHVKRSGHENLIKYLTSKGLNLRVWK